MRLDDDDDEDKGTKPPAPMPLIQDRLFKKRHILITGAINDKVAQSVSAQLLALAADGDDPINLFISSPGGHVESGDMIYDMIKFVGPVVRTIGTGWVASAGALIFVGAPKEHRYCLPNTRFLLHQPSGGMMGKAVDVAIQAEQIIKMKQRLNEIFASETGQPIERVARDTDRDYWMTPDEALAYGLLGKVVRSHLELT
ncbi:ATP-dependent Clp protease proteolytic subunit [Marinivivus vitaminiproducens]|uniref:ATP-dependent Clp protease proteolytic subunit n=1 Tax=Marinivivus vitaminiproducens TaxID=3035935 RepID=UPI0027A7E7F4|nr:ATP-dependent Clp protease proteolytic subunit [Geminicoccaceae bacterium SCSIO 64248]